MIFGLQLVAFFAMNPYLAHLADWRNTVIEEADALMHASVVKVLPWRSPCTISSGVSGQLRGHWAPATASDARAGRLQSRPIHCV